MVVLIEQSPKKCISRRFPKNRQLSLSSENPSPGLPGRTAKEKDVSGIKRQKRTMAEKQKCERCGKDAYRVRVHGRRLLNMSAKTMPTASSSLSNPARKKCTACAFSNGSNNGSGLFFKGEQTMDKRPGCEYCSKPAIGIQSLGCCVSYVCEGPCRRPSSRPQTRGKKSIRRVLP